MHPKEELHEDKKVRRVSWRSSEESQPAAERPFRSGSIRRHRQRITSEYESRCSIGRHAVKRGVLFRVRANYGPRLRKWLLAVFLIVLVASVIYTLGLLLSWSPPRGYLLEREAVPLQERFSRPAKYGSGDLYSDLFSVNVGKGFRISAFTHDRELGTPYQQRIGGVADAGLITFTARFESTVLENGLVLSSAEQNTRAIEYDAIHGVYEETWKTALGITSLTAAVWVGYPYGRFGAAFTPTKNGNLSGEYVLEWQDPNSAPSDFIIPRGGRYVSKSVTGKGEIDLLSEGLHDNFVVFWGAKACVEVIIFEKRPAILSYDPNRMKIHVVYSELATTTNRAVAFPTIFIGFLKTTDNERPNLGELAVAKEIAHSALSFPASAKISYSVQGSSVTVRHTYTFSYAENNDWHVAKQPIIPVPYGVWVASAPLFTCDAVWGELQFVTADASDSASFLLTPSVPGFALPLNGRTLTDGTVEARLVYSYIDEIEGAQGTEGEWDGLAYHDGRVVTHILLMYPALNDTYKKKVADITRRTLDNYYSRGIVYNDTFDMYRFVDITQKKWENAVDIGALTCWLFYATLLYTQYVNESFAANNLQRIVQVERGLEKIVDWSGIPWASPALDTSGELILESTMAFLVYYHLAEQFNDIIERDRATYFAGLTQNFLLNVFEKPQRYWSYPPLVGTYVMGAVFDHVDQPGTPWNWANTIWGLWTPVMSTSYTAAYVNPIKQTAERDWDWNRPQGKKFIEEYLNFNMILLYMNDPEAKKNLQMLLQLHTANESRDDIRVATAPLQRSSAMILAEQAAQVVYGLLTPRDS